MNTLVHMIKTIKRHLDEAGWRSDCHTLKYITTRYDNKLVVFSGFIPVVC